MKTIEKMIINKEVEEVIPILEKLPFPIGISIPVADLTPEIKKFWVSQGCSWHNTGRKIRKGGRELILVLSLQKRRELIRSKVEKRQRRLKEVKHCIKNKILIKEGAG